jgi:hypothetical protein
VSGIRIEDVFKVNGVPTYTFVRPSAYNHIQVALRTPGRGVVIEGPSGIGKSTAVSKAIDDLGLGAVVTKLSARIPEDTEYLEMLPELGSFGTVIIDDFHRLEASAQGRIADLLKVTADSEDPNRKLVLIGINEAGGTLIEASPDLTGRIDVIRFEAEPSSKITELVEAGETAAKIKIDAGPLIVEKAGGSFFIAQMLCLEACIQADVLEVEDVEHEIETPYSAIQRRVVERQRDKFGTAVRNFARGTKFRPGGRAPYLHILRWLSDSDSWSINIPEEMRRHASEKASVLVVMDRGYLRDLVRQPDISKLLHLSDSGVLSVEDPMLVFYLRSLNWGDFVKEVGFTQVDYGEPYDVALSFAGEDREFAEHLRDALEDLNHVVFYDHAEQHRILGEDVEAYLGPIYASGSRYVAAVLGEMYGVKRWTLFEAEKYKDRIDKGQVLPIWSTKVPASAFDPTRRLGCLFFDPDKPLLAQAKEHAEVISKKLAEIK